MLNERGYESHCTRLCFPLDYLEKTESSTSLNVWCCIFERKYFHSPFGTGVLDLIHINHKPNATVFQFIILTFVYSSTYFGRFPAHHQELNDCSGNLWFYLRIVVIVVLCSWSMNTARLSPRYEGKTRGCHCSHWAPDDGRENTRNMLSCKQTSG